MKYLLSFLFAVLFVCKVAQIGIPANLSWWWICSPLILNLVLVFGLSMYAAVKKQREEIQAGILDYVQKRLFQIHIQKTGSPMRFVKPTWEEIAPIMKAMEGDDPEALVYAVSAQREEKEAKKKAI